MGNREKYWDKRFSYLKDLIKDMPDDTIKAKQYLSGKITSLHNKWLSEQNRKDKRIFKELMELFKQIKG